MSNIIKFAVDNDLKHLKSLMRLRNADDKIREAVFVSCMYDHLAMFIFLEKSGVDICAVNYADSSSLVIACLHDHNALARLIIKKAGVDNLSDRINFSDMITTRPFRDFNKRRLFARLENIFLFGKDFAFGIHGTEALSLFYEYI